MLQDMYSIFIFFAKKNMKRDIVKIDEKLCNGCGVCIPSCKEGALQIIDGKARLVSDLMCDGLGACLNDCPQGAITIEHREAEPYNETKVMKMMVEQGKNTVIAHLKHLKEHGEHNLLKEGVKFLMENENNLNFTALEVVEQVHPFNPIKENKCSGGGCPGAQAKTLTPKDNITDDNSVSGGSELRQWPVQMHLINPSAAYFKNSDLLIAADCVAYSVGNFHQKFLKGKSLAIACPKLDTHLEVYSEKITALIDEANVNTITVMIMQVPCCGGLLQLTKTAAQKARRKVPIKLLVVSLEGDLLKEEWI